MGMNRTVWVTDEWNHPKQEVTASPKVISECRARVKRGAAFLDRKVPGWRRVLRRHEDTFDICQSDCCVLGTLAAHPPKALRAQLKITERALGRTSYDYYGMLKVLGIAGNASTWFEPLTEQRASSLGFLTAGPLEHLLIDVLWRAEFTR